MIPYQLNQIVLWQHPMKREPQTLAKILRYGYTLPPHNHAPYTVLTLDGLEVRAYNHELTPISIEEVAIWMLQR